MVKDDYSDDETKDYVMSSAKSSDDTYMKVERKDTKQAILNLIYDLPEKQQKPILMFYYQAMKYDEIADALDIPVGTVRSRISAAKKSLKQLMEGGSYV